MDNESWYRDAVQALRQAGWSGPDARVVARLLLDGATGLRHAHLIAARQRLEPGTIIKLRSATEEALRHRPLPYILGTREFFGRPFRCDERALIPRPETELLLEIAIRRFAGQPSPRLADLGTGTGCIAISVALELPEARVFATDVSSSALQLARENAAALKAEVQFRQGILNDWAGPLRADAPFHAVLSNPPYIAIGEIETLQPEIRDFEPHGALDGGPDGLDQYRLIAEQCDALLAPAGFLALELGAGQFDDVSALFSSKGWRVEPPVHDLAGHARVLVAFR